MLLLPTFNATLSPCSVNPASFTAHANGHFCASCQRVVQDFSQSQNPLADLAAARAAAPDGRVCGSFRAGQVQPPAAPALSRRLRWFLLALVLVVGQGLTAREALAQVRRPVPHKQPTLHKKNPTTAKKQPADAIEILDGKQSTIGIIGLGPIEAEQPDSTRVYTYTEQMPRLPGGGSTQAIVAYIQQRVRYPKDLRGDIEGRVFATFIVGKEGLVREAHIVKGLHPLLDAEALRAIRELPTFTPGRQNGQPVAVSFTVPVSFRVP